MSFNADMAIEEALTRISQEPLKKINERERAKLKDSGREGAKVELGHRYLQQGLQALHAIRRGKSPEGDLPQKLEQVAQGYFLTGDLDLAIEFSQAHKDHYRSYLTALNQEHRCDCVSKQVKTKLGPVEVGGYFLKERFLYGSSWYNLMACSKCGHTIAE